MLGKTFGRLTVVSKHPERKRAYIQWICECECGNEVVVISNKLRSGHTRSCGCLQKEVVRKMALKHGESRTKNPLYTVWNGMRARCGDTNHKSYDRYGGRGIRVCKEWDDYQLFEIWAMSNGYERGMELDRLDNDEGYSPDNCDWVSRKTNMRNTSHNVIIEGLYLTDWFSSVANETGLKESTVKNRYYRLKKKNIDITTEDVKNYLNL